jgi:WW domain
MAWYIETQFQNIVVDWPARYVQEARVAWVHPPSLDALTRKNPSSGNTKIPIEDVLPDPWLTNITLRGEVYYWNSKTRQSQWEHPVTGQTFLEKK